MGGRDGPPNVLRVTVWFYFKILAEQLHVFFLFTDVTHDTSVTEQNWQVNLGSGYQLSVISNLKFSAFGN